MRDLSKLFNQYFELTHVNSPELLQQVFRMRYLVYCQEQARFPCFNSCNHTLQMEEDKYDMRSTHYLCRHRISKKDVGSVRLVLPVSDNELAMFPTEKLEGNLLYKRRINNNAISGHKIAEISRLCITREFRLRIGEADTPYGYSKHSKGSQPTKARAFPHPILALFIAIVRMSVENDITHWYVLMENSLIRILGRFGVYFNPVGPKIDAYGSRQPCFSSIVDVLQGIHSRRPDVWHLIAENVDNINANYAFPRSLAY